MRFRTLLRLVTLSAAASPLAAQAKALEGRLMSRDAEMALALSAAPPSVTDAATVLVLASDGYQAARNGANGFTCLVLRSWAAPTFTPIEIRNAVLNYPALRAPICYNPAASRTVLPYQEMRAKLGIAGKSAEEMAVAISAAYVTGKLPRAAETGFAYMFSASQDLGPGVGAWHPHMMVFAPYAENASMGGNPFGGPLPLVTDDAGTPFAVTVIPVDPALAIRAR